MRKDNMEMEKESYMEEVEAYFDHNKKLWIVRLAEYVEGATQEEAELKAKRKLVAYWKASDFVISPITICKEADAAELNHYISKNKKLQAENEKLKGE
jgi:hypothetical protein